MSQVRLIGHTVWLDELDQDQEKFTALTVTKEELKQSMSDMIAYCARVSNPSNQNNHKTAAKLLKYCVKHKHWSVFEMGNIVLEINTTRDISRQILRHRSFHFQEFSQRYADVNELGFVTRKARYQDKKNRQNSIDLDEHTQHDNILLKEFQQAQDRVLDVAREEYDRMLGFGIAKEQARALLPEGLSMSKLYMNGTVRDWFHYCHLRMGPETQLEHREIAQKCWEHLIDICPFLEDVEVKQ